MLTLPTGCHFHLRQLNSKGNVMKLMQVLKMLSKDDDWKYVTTFSCSPDMVEVTHKSGIFYFKGCYAAALRKGNREAYKSSPFSGLITELVSRILERKLNKRSQ